MALLENVLALIVTLGVLVTIHEWGHFWVARRCGVKVLRFSVGFGRPLVSWRDRLGTEYAIAAIPLGGYVKMLDEREAPVDPSQTHLAFNRKPVGQRIAIVAAGPLANFIFAVLAYWVLLVAGITVVVPLVGPVEEGSIAAQAGLQTGEEVTAVDGRMVSSWSDVSFRLLDRLGDTGDLRLTVQAEVGSLPREVVLPIENWLAGEAEPDPLAALGFEPWRPAIDPVVQEVVTGGRADLAGVVPGDRVLVVDGGVIASWEDFVERVKAAPEQALLVLVQRGDQQIELTITPEGRPTAEGVQGFVGIAVVSPEWPEHLRREVSISPWEAVPQALVKTGEMAAMILDSLKKLILGVISVENLGGPITIAKAAGASANIGLESFLSFLAQLSVMLGVLNLLPVPVLDGGHLLYYVIELVRGRPLSEEKQILGLKIGMAILAGVMALALFNDFARL